METEKQTVAVVTGAANGIGRVIAESFATAGYAVALVDIDLSTCKKTADQISLNTGAVTLAVEADVSDIDSCVAGHDEIKSQLGNVHILVNNAGIMPQQKGWIEQLPPEHFRHMMAIHVEGAVNWSRLVIPDMRTRGFGRIINISSVNAILAVPFRLGYVTAKKAMLGLTEALAIDCARAGITVNAVATGYTLTETLESRAENGLLDLDAIKERTPVGRWGKPEEIANAVKFLADVESGFITGTTLVVDGGLTIRGDPDEDLNHSPFEND